MEDNVQKIKERVDIVDLISGYLKLQKAGVNYKARCPFHSEKTPSFSVSPERQIWHCFGCGKGGDHFTFIEEIEGTDFPEALKMLAKKAGVELRDFDRSFQNEKTKLLEICELAAKFFEKQLWRSNVGQKALAYLKERGVQDDFIKNFRLGFAPESWQSLSDFLNSKGYRNQEIFESGMSIRRESRDGFYDRFRSRIIFPVTDANAQVVGFTGRIFPDQKDKDSSDFKEAKYINTPQTPIYDKSKILYGLDKARSQIKKVDQCLVVEGNMDVVLSHQAGVVHAVASSGTALTDQHLKVIKRFTNNLNLCFDQDSAGSNATERGIALALENNFNVSVLGIDDPECKDPADFVKKFGLKWREQAKNSKPLIEFYIEHSSRLFDSSTAVGKKMIADKVLPFIKTIPNEIERSHWVGDLAVRLAVKEETLIRQMETMQNKLSDAKTISSVSNKKEHFFESASFDLLEEYLISLLMLKPQLASGADQQKIGFFSDKLATIFSALAGYLNEKPFEKAIDYILQKSADKNLGLEKMYLEKLYLQAQEVNFDDKMLAEDFDMALKRLQERKVKAKMVDLELAIKKAQKEQNKDLTAKLINEAQITASFLNSVKTI
ncbi:MAG: DNA primase [Candidatus Yanofskybacteria bacterium]|nr:DNA primase [Candidatus Yanofskybacteria bacterium]